MIQETQWIPLSGPGSRLPTENDASNWGGVYVANDKTSAVRSWALIESQWTHWAPIPKSPPLPKPVELSQEEKDKAKAVDLCAAWSNNPDGPIWLAIEGIRYGRADGRNQLAAECLALFDRHAWLLPDLAKILSDDGNTLTAAAIRRLHELLVKAQEEKP